jgi:hypothetical protein
MSADIIFNENKQYLKNQVRLIVASHSNDQK